MTATLHHWQDLDVDQRTALLERPAMRDDATLRESVGAILATVRAKGDEALRDYSRRFDGAEVESFEVSAAEVAAAEAQMSAAALAAIDTAIANVTRFHDAQRPGTVRVETMPGVVCEKVSRPIDAVGLYVPAGSAPLPSAAVMLAVPAAIAACPVRILCTPPRRDGSADAAVITAATRAGIQRIFKVGGAQAIAAMAYGTESVPRVAKIFGPGNAWVTCAKSLVSTEASGAAIDMPAGPSEVLVIADDSANADFVAADLLSQAEHGADSQVILVTDSTDLARSVQARLQTQLAALSRRETASAALAHARLLVVANLDEALAVSNRYAPEHLILQCRNARTLLPAVRNAGSVFLGPWSPESAGDYCSGTNHVLPTYGYARNYSGLGVEQFLRSMTVQELSEAGLRALAPTVLTLAELEGLDAHANAVRLRLGASA